MSKKAQMIFLIPAVLVGFAVMIYCFATNVGGDNPLLYSLGAMLATFLVLYLLVGKRISVKEAPAGARVDLRKHLTEEEIKILLSDLQVASGKVPPDQMAALDALVREITSTGSIHVKTLPVCVSAAEMDLGVFSAFGLAPAGHSALLDKLKKLAETA
jgi:hypothetical protein